MSNEIQTGKIPVSVANTKSKASQAVSTQKTGATSPGAAQTSSADTVSMTDAVSHLKEIEGMLKNMPKVNSALVSEVSQLISEGRLEINLERTASRLLEAEAGVTDPGT